MTRIEWQQRLTLHAEAYSRLPHRKYHFDGRDPSRQDELVQGGGDPVAQRGDAVRLRRHCTLPCRCHVARGGKRKTAAADKEKVRRPTPQGVIENSFCEFADKSLLGTEDDPRISGGQLRGVHRLFRFHVQHHPLRMQGVAFPGELTGEIRIAFPITQIGGPSTGRSPLVAKPRCGRA